MIPNLGGGGNATNPLTRIFDIIGSKGGQTLTNAIGAGMSAYGANKQSEADRALNAQQFAANLAQRQLEGDRDFQLTQAKSAADADALGAAQGFAQKQALLKAILPGLRNTSFTPGDPRVASAMGSFTGGFRLPEGGFDPAMIDRLFGDAATQASLSNRSKQLAAVNPTGSYVNLEDLYGPSSPTERNPYQTSAEDYRQQEMNRQLDESKRQREVIQRAIDEDVNGTKQKKSKGSKAKSALGGAASGAMTGAQLGSILPGLGTGVGAAIGGIGGFLKGLF